MLAPFWKNEPLKPGGSGTDNSVRLFFLKGKWTNWRHIAFMEAKLHRRIYHARLAMLVVGLVLAYLLAFMVKIWKF